MDADELQDVARAYAVAMSMRLPEEVEADVERGRGRQNVAARRDRLDWVHLTLRLPNVGCTSGIGGICQVPVIGMPVSRLIITSITVGAFDRIASR